MAQFMSPGSVLTRGVAAARSNCRSSILLRMTSSYDTPREVSETDSTCVILRHTQAYFLGRRDFDTLRSTAEHDIEVVTS